MATPDPPPSAPSSAPPSPSTPAPAPATPQHCPASASTAPSEQPPPGALSTLDHSARGTPASLPPAPALVQHTQPQAHAAQDHRPLPPAPRPWWRPPARNFRPHPGNHAPNSFFSSTSPASAGTAAGVHSHSLSSLSAGSGSHGPPSENLLCYWYRALSYILRIPFRELVGNVVRPYDPTAPQPLADVPLHIGTLDESRQHPNPYSGLYRSQNNRRVQGSATTRSATSSGITPVQNTTRSWQYIPQMRKAWGDRTSSMSWALSTAFFTSVLCTIVAIAALVLNWSVSCTYLKVFLIAFVVRKWIVSFLMIDRALYRLPLGLTEPDPDIDEERHNSVAIYMSQLFTWHGYAILLFGNLYVFVYGVSQYMAEAPIITGVAIAFSCMGLVPFFALLALMLGALVLLYLFYIMFVCVIWPLEKCGLRRRRAISRRNGGYRSDGTTNTTDLRQVAQAIEDASNEDAGAARGRNIFGGAENVKVTQAMAAIPIVIFRKPKQEGSTTALETTEPRTLPVTAKETGTALASSHSSSVSDQQEARTPLTEQSLSSSSLATPRELSRRSSAESVDATAEKSSTGLEHKGPTSSVLRASGDQPVAISVPASSTSDYQNDVLNKMPSSLSVLCASTPNARSRTSSASYSTSGVVGAAPAPWIVPGQKSSQSSSAASFIPCLSGQEMDELAARMKTVQPIEGASTRVHQMPASSSASRLMTGSKRDSVHNTSRRSSNRNSRRSTLLITDESSVRKELVDPPPSLPARPTDATAAAAALGRQESVSITIPESSEPVVAEESASPRGFYPTIHDEECAICLFDFEDGDELRHLYCDHFFHRTCVDRWLVKNAFCPKCKRHI
ncbi:unnamed protein product [Mortierella alpina]